MSVLYVRTLRPRLLSGLRMCHHVSMSDSVRDELTRDSRAFGRADRARERAREQLGDTIRRASEAGIGPAEITRLIEHRLTEKTVIRISKGDA